MENEMLLQVVSILWILFIASYSLILWKKTNIPYVVLLFLIWIVIVILKDYLPFFYYIDNLQLTWDLLFYVLLPILLFESAFNMSSKKLIYDSVSIISLSIWGFIISNIIIWYWLFFALKLVWLDVPLFMTFLFWAVISATDPVAVLSLFKNYWAPQRLTYLFEWESIMNDWVSVAFFFIIIDIIRRWVFELWDLTFWILIFSWMMIFWIIWWVFIWWLFSKLIQKVHNINTELTLSLILAHTAFISAELISKFFFHLSEDTWIEIFKMFQLSPIIATAVAWLMLWNYWQFKLSADVRSLTKYFFDYFTFISNSIIFILMWILIWNYFDLIMQFWLPISLAVIIVIISRALSIWWITYPLNLILHKHNKIPNNWSWLLAWWSLRWWIAVTIVLLTPKDLNIPWWNTSLWLTPYEFLAAFTISCIVFTLTVKALSIWKMMRKMWILELSKKEIFTMEQIRHLLDHKMIDVLSWMKNKKYTNSSIIENLMLAYKNDELCEEEKLDNLKLSEGEIRSLLQVYSLWIEKQSIIKAFENNEIDEYSLKLILYKIDKQQLRLGLWLSQLTEKESEILSLWQKFMNKIYNWIYFWWNPVLRIKHRYLYYRARVITSEAVINELESLKSKFCKFDNKYFDEVIKRYQAWFDDANSKKLVIYNESNNFLKSIDEELTNKQALYKEMWFLNSYLQKWILTQKTYNSLYRVFTKEEVLD